VSHICKNTFIEATRKRFPKSDIGGQMWWCTLVIPELEAEAGGYQVQGHPRQHSKPLLPKPNKKNEINFNEIFYLTQLIQNIISTCSEYKNY
jgi:hypothetical protein